MAFMLMSAMSCKKSEDPAPVPVSASVTKIDINKIPFADASGSGWDLTNGPDVYLVFGATATSTILIQTSPATDVSVADLPLRVVPTTPIPVQLGTLYEVDIADHDSPDADDIIGIINSINFNDYKNSAPSKITVGTNPQVSIYVTWTY